jgi:RIO-like serine/threonine protein kinase
MKESECKLALAISRYMNIRSNECSVSYNTLKELSGIRKDETISNNLKRLQELELIQIENRKPKSNKYKFPAPKYTTYTPR